MFEGFNKSYYQEQKNINEKNFSFDYYSSPNKIVIDDSNITIINSNGEEKYKYTTLLHLKNLIHMALSVSIMHDTLASKISIYINKDGKHKYESTLYRDNPNNTCGIIVCNNVMTARIIEEELANFGYSVNLEKNKTLSLVFK